MKIKGRITNIVSNIFYVEVEDKIYELLSKPGKDYELEIALLKYKNQLELLHRRIELKRNTVVKHGVSILEDMSIKKLEKQYLEVEKKLENFAYSLTFNKEDAKDLVQDTYLKAILHQNAFEEGSNLNAWLFTIMKNTFINSYRRTKKEKTIIFNEV